LLRQHIIHGWGHPSVICHNGFFTEALVEKDDGRQGEHNWHSNSIEQCQESNVQRVRVLLMDQEVSTTPYFFKTLNSSRLGIVGVH